MERSLLMNTPESATLHIIQALAGGRVQRMADTLSKAWQSQVGGISRMLLLQPQVIHVRLHAICRMRKTDPHLFDNRVAVQKILHERLETKAVRRISQVPQSVLC